jgi:hypothetical protein
MTTARALTAAHPRPDTPVLVNRELRTDAHPRQLSVFADARWDLTAGVFEDHVLGVSMSFQFAPPRWREDVKHYIWLLINDPQPPGMRRAPTGRLCLRSIALLGPKIGRLLAWCEARGIDSLALLDERALEVLLAHVRDLEASTAVKSGVLTEVRRLWVFRHLLPQRLRLPEPLPWGGEDTRDLLGVSCSTGLENRTPRIHQAVLGPLLTWAIRFVTDLAEDITAAYHQWVALSTNQPPVHNGAAAMEQRMAGHSHCSPNIGWASPATSGPMAAGASTSATSGGWSTATPMCSAAARTASSTLAYPSTTAPTCPARSPPASTAHHGAHGPSCSPRHPPSPGISVPPAS